MKKKIQILMVCLLVGLQCLLGPAQLTQMEVEAAQTASKATTIKIKAGKKSDITKKVNEAMEKARKKATASKPYKIVIPKGTYYISGSIYLCSNVTLEATGATIKFRGNSRNTNMLLSDTIGSKSPAKTKGYKGCRNITISGGTYVGAKSNKSNLVKLAHGKNITIKNATFSGGGGIHQVEVCAIDGFTVTGCTFKDFKAGKSKSSRQEALQLDVPVAEDIFADVYQDGTMMKNVNISNNTFSNVPRGLGSHSMLLGAFHENIKIMYNTFTDVKEEAIVTANYYNCEIAYNDVKNSGAGIILQGFKTKTDSVYSTAEDAKPKKQNYKTLKTSIHDNQMQIVYSASCDRAQGIYVYGCKLAKSCKGGDKKSIKKGNYYAAGVQVKNNTITTAGHGIVLSGAKDCQVTGNIVRGKGFTGANAVENDGISVRGYSQTVTIRQNQISGMPRYGILVRENSGATAITDNKVENVKDTGIEVYSNGQVTREIAGNTVSKAGGNGILIGNYAKAGSVKNNKISQVGAHGIMVYDHSAVTGEIRGNSVMHTGKNGIILNAASKSGTIRENTLSQIKQIGVRLYDKSQVTGDITDNKFSAVTGREVQIGNDCSVSGSVQE
ncbi:right-handed parallel beta-helix repeat-containing protein [Kineothrix sp. MSJ-39]|uniref:right-handed parallel beta-helix repeat-containing protein n=1 Tax=Kineothrix sp. MSJ-39 TaxID=2841533 RepID=UPI001C0FD9B0|nr:right-handed parallel beta-helix repeat-containing protein [Kineothrix sp. MSJ-39]MBU5429194.1 right-handed parallel beta-helix repeat-containing protein [Kineothrix sp. MSJ-39]